MLYAPKPALGHVTLSLIGKNPDEQHRLACEALLAVTLPNTFSRLGIDVTVLQQHRVSGRVLEVDVSASKNGVPLKTSNPFQFLNPPVCAPNGTYRKGFASKGEPIDIMNESENPLEALKIAIAHSIIASQ